jgi:PAS domain S-box-containing protein
MNVDQLLQWLTQTLFVGVFLVAAVRAVRRHQRVNLDTALLFGAASLSIALTWVQQALPVAPNWMTQSSGSLGLALPYLLLRLVDDFIGVRRLLLRLAEVGLAFAVLMLFVFESSQPAWLTVFLVAYFAVLEVYAARRFLIGARRSSGVTRRRMQAVAAGSACLGLTVIIAGLQTLVPTLAGVWVGLFLVLELASGVGYALGFAPPLLLRRAWQEPEVRAFFRSVAQLPQLRDTGSIVQTLEAAVAGALGAPGISIGFWDDAAQVLRFYARDPGTVTVRVSEQPATTSIVSRVFTTQEPIFVTNAAQEDPAHAEEYRAAGATAILAVPITVGQSRLGVLAAFAPRAFVFTEDDLELAQILANQVALALGYARELLERQRVEAEIAERRRAEAALFDSEARMAAIVETALDPIISMDHAGRIVEFNPAAERVFGYGRAEVLGREMAEVIIPPHLRDQHRRRLARDLAGGESLVLDQRLELAAMRADQTEFPIELAIVRMAADSPLVFTGYLRDITDQKRAESLIRNLNTDLERRVLERTAQLEDTVRELEAFSYSVSHDLRAPLRAVNGFSRILLQDYGSQLAPEAQGYLRMVSENAQQMGRLIDDLLAFSQLGRQQLRTQRVLPAEVVRGALDGLAPEREGREVQIVLDELAVCQADPVLLRQVYVNLLSNALKFTRRRADARIEIGCRELEGEVTYFVKDNGAGFDMRYADKLFGVFQRLHRAEDYDGTGVGLAIVNRIVHRHGGRVWAEAAVDQGATFFFTLALSDAQVSEGELERSSAGGQITEEERSDDHPQAA